MIASAVFNSSSKQLIDDHIGTKIPHILASEEDGNGNFNFYPQAFLQEVQDCSEFR